MNFKKICTKKLLSTAVLVSMLLVAQTALAVNTDEKYGAYQNESKTISEEVSNRRGLKPTPPPAVPSGAWDTRGGAVYISSGNLTINGDGAFKDNDAIIGDKVEYMGGAIYSVLSGLNIDGTIGNYIEFENNRTLSRGGAIYFSGVTGNDVAIDYAIFTKNSSYDIQHQSEGGAIHEYGNHNLTISNSFFGASNVADSGNTSVAGGALYLNALKTIEITNTDFYYNKAQSSNQSRAVGGGAIYITQPRGPITVSNSIFEENTATRTNLSNAISNDGGGAIQIYTQSDYDITIENSTFTRNKAISERAENDKYIRGGAINFQRMSDGAAKGVVIKDTTFTENEAQMASVPENALGGAIYNDNSYTDKLTITDTQFEKNKAGKGGAIYNIRGILNINKDNGESLFKENEAVSIGGAIYHSNAQLSAYPSLNIENTTFESNKTTSSNGAGGALFIDVLHNASSSIKNSTFTGNSASKGGAIYNGSAGNLTITDTNFSGNKASVEGAAIYDSDTGSYGTYTQIIADAQNVTFSNNNLTGAAGGTGTGIYSKRDLYLNANAGKSITIGDAIQLVDSTSYLYINSSPSNATSYQGTVALNGALNIAPYANIVLGGGTLKLGQTPATGTYDITSNAEATLDLQNNKAGDIITVPTLEGSSSSPLNLKVDFNADTGAMDKLTVNGFNYSPKITLTDVNVLTDGEATSATYLDGSKRQNVSVISTAIESVVTSGGYKYTFTPDLATHGLLSVTRESAVTFTLPEMIADTTGAKGSIFSITTDDFKPLNDGTYDELGTLAGTNRQFKIYSNGVRSMDGTKQDGSKGSGIVVGNVSGQKLTVENIYGFKNFTTAITNKAGGTVEVAGTSFADNTTADIHNEGTLNLTSGNVSFAKGITDNATTRTGITNISGGNVSIGTTGSVMQKTLNILSGKLTARANQLDVTDDILNSGTLELAGATLNEKVTGTGSTVITGDLISNSSIANAITVNTSRTLTIGADNVDGAVTSLGTVALKAGTLAQAITGGTINFTENITSNANYLKGNTQTVANTKKLTLTGGDLTKAISGAGSVTIDGTVGTSANISNAITVNAGKTLNINNGITALGEITNKGETNFNTDFILTNEIVASTYSDGNKINIKNGAKLTLADNVYNQNIIIENGSLIANTATAYLDYPTNNLTLGTNGILDLSSNDKSINSITLDKFTGSTAATSGIKFDTDFAQAGQKSDKITIDGIALGTVNLQSVNVKNDFAGDIGTTQTITLFDGGGVLIDLILGTTETVLGAYKYVFTEGATKGTLLVTKGNGYSLQEVIQNSVSGAGNVSTYSFNVDQTLAADLGTLTRVNASTPRELTINGNNKAIIANGKNGITVNSGDTLSVTNVNGYKNFTTAITNAGNVNLDGVIFENNSVADIANNGTVTFKAHSSTLSKGVRGTGTTNINGMAMTLGADSKIIQNTLNITNAGSLTTSASNVKASISNAVANGLIFNGGENTNAITGVGSTKIAGIVTNTGSIGQAVNIVSGSLTTDASLLGGTIKNDATLNLTGGTLAKAITNTYTVTPPTSMGTLNIDGATTVSANVYQNTMNVNAALTNNAEIEVNSIDLNKNINGSGILMIFGDNDISTSNATIVQSKVMTDYEVIANVGQITAPIEIIGGLLILKGGTTEELTQSNDIEGSTLIFEGKVHNTGNLDSFDLNNNGELRNTGRITDYIHNAGTLTSSASNIDADIQNNGTYNIQGGTLNNWIYGTGTIKLAENEVLRLGTNAIIDDNTFKAGNNSTLDMSGAGSKISMTINGLKIAAGEKMNLAIDFNDTFNSTVANIEGKVNISKIDLHNITANRTHPFTNLGEKMVLDKNAELITGSANDSSNHVKYIATGADAGELHASRRSLIQAVDAADNNVNIYSMSAPEGGGNEELDGSLVIQGNSNTLTGSGIKIADNSNLTIRNLHTASGTTLNFTGNGGNSSLEINNTSGGQLNLAGDIIATGAKNNNVLFSGANDIKADGYIDPLIATVNLTNAELIRGGYDDDIQWNLNAGTLRYTDDKYLYDPTMHGSTYALNSLNFNGGNLDLRNNVATNGILLSSATLSGNSNIYLDVDLAAGKMDNFGATPVTYTAGTLNVKGFGIVSDATADYIEIPFTTDAALMGHVAYTGSDLQSAIYKYSVNYQNTTGKFGFKRSGGFSSSALIGPVAAQVGSYLTQLNIYEQAFGNMDMIMNMTREQRTAMKYANKYASQGTGQGGSMTFSPNQIPEQDKGVWFKPFATFETVGLSDGPDVGNIAYGSLFGMDSEIIELSHGWDMTYSLYAGYNGSHQTYDDIGIYQNGGTLGASAAFYKGNFFTGLTANVGANVGDANSLFGKETFTMLATGIASKTGYNFEFFDGKFIIQPNYLMSYTFVNTFDYTNAAGISVQSDPLNAIQIAPGIKFIGNLKDGWQPYASVQMVWNIMDQARFYANNVSLPELSVRPYVQYGLGLQKRWGDRFTAYAQAMIRNGGRNGVALQAGFRWALGKDPKEISKEYKESKITNTINTVTKETDKSPNTVQTTQSINLDNAKLNVSSVNTTKTAKK